MKLNLTPSILALFTLASPALAGLKENKKVVTDFYDLAFNQYQSKEAALKFLSPEYIQHNPHVATGRDAFIEAFAGEKPEGHADFKRVIAEGDLVVLHSFKTRKAGDRGVVGVDIFRVKNGKITEHWDVNQAIPEESKNKNSMF